MPTSPAQPIIDRCLEENFVAAGVVPARRSPTAAQFQEWLAEGRHGEMHWMAEHVDVRVDPRELVPGARSVIVVADRYDGSSDDNRPPGGGRIARYARGRDYHRYMKKRLHRVADALLADHPGEVFRACVDTAPILEREVAAAAGLGAIGKHTLLIEPAVGSWLLLGEIVTTLEVEPTGSDERLDPCGTCTRCIEACPTDAITPWSVDASRCVSYLTIEHRTRIDPAFHEGMGDWLFGCDLCQEACPHNQPTDRTASSSREAQYEARSEGRDAAGASFDIREVLDWTEEDRRRAFETSAMKRAKLGMMRRNAVIVAGNLARGGGAPDLLDRLAQLAADPSEDELVRATARDVLAQLGDGAVET
ncbi:MAG: tRNA epoxyqueuosine(34) reductase QueG [Phycisphaerales bacterium]|nr:tRNA epoxyqueuosine(34) reductase QueG [Phycisphaerales bacterium]